MADIQFQGKTLPLADRVSLFDLMKCIVLKIPPIQKELAFLVDPGSDWLVERSDEIKSTQKEILYQLISGDIIASGEQCSFKRHHTNSADLKNDFGSIYSHYEIISNNSPILKIDRSLWVKNYVDWPNNRLITHVGKIEFSEDFRNSYKHGTCIANITLSVNDIKKFWPYILKNEGSQKGDQESTLKGKERTSLLRLVLGMAMAKYGYNPKAAKSPTAKKIASDLLEKGIKLDEDTIRKWLKESAEFMPDEM